MDTIAIRMIVFPCQVCRAKLSSDEARIGKLVKCPSCDATQRVPAPVEEVPVAAIAIAPPPPPPPPRPVRPQTTVKLPAVAQSTLRSGTGKRYGFNCPYCSSRLEATDMMAAQEGQCPTCGSTIVIPMLDRYGRLIDPLTKKIIKPDPHPVHAYAAAGERAPQIVHTRDKALAIRCPRCPAISPITANNCKACGMPFTMEGTTVEPVGASNGFCVASLVLGVVGLPASCTLILPIVAIVFGIIGLLQVGKTGGGGRTLAIIGIGCGLVGCWIAFEVYWR